MCMNQKYGHQSQSWQNLYSNRLVTKRGCLVALAGNWKRHHDTQNLCRKHSRPNKSKMLWRDRVIRPKTPVVTGVILRDLQKDSTDMYMYVTELDDGKCNCWGGRVVVVVVAEERWCCCCCVLSWDWEGLDIEVVGDNDCWSSPLIKYSPTHAKHLLCVVRVGD